MCRMRGSPCRLGCTRSSGRTDTTACGRVLGTRVWLRPMSVAGRTVGGMTKQVQQILEYDVLDEPCPRCASTSVRVVVGFTSTSAADASGAEPLAHDDPLFDCRECGFEWGELVRDLMS
jgi:hypothetical protein